VIESPQLDENEYGGAPRKYAVFRECAAAVVPLAGSELVWAQQLHATATHLLVIRWTRGITPAMRVNYRGKFFEIGLVLDPEEQRQFLELLCVEEVTG
jgi:SPP1 family predicted phage head-tail adaptor